MLDLLGIDDTLAQADVVVTGEGRIDGQTVRGKAPVGIAQRAKRQNPNVRTIGLCGCATPDAIAVNEHGLDAYFPILHAPMTVEEAMDPDTAACNLEQTALQIFHLLSHR